MYRALNVNKVSLFLQHSPLLLLLCPGGFDYVFWLGDLNYRVDMDRAEVDRHLQQQQQQQGWMPLLLHDQLTKEILRGKSEIPM